MPLHKLNYFDEDLLDPEADDDELADREAVGKDLLEQKADG